MVFVGFHLVECDRSTENKNRSFLRSLDRVSFGMKNKFECSGCLLTVEWRSSQALKWVEQTTEEQRPSVLDFGRRFDGLLVDP